MSNSATSSSWARANSTCCRRSTRSSTGSRALIVTEYPDALEDGSVVNFVKVDNTLKYELSVVNASKHKLEVGSTLKQLAQRVDE